MNKSGPLTEPVAIAAVNQYFDDLIALADPGAVLPHLRAELGRLPRSHSERPLPHRNSSTTCVVFCRG